MRISIKQHNYKFLNDYARQVGMSPTNALDFLLNSLRMFWD